MYFKKIGKYTIKTKKEGHAPPPQNSHSQLKRAVKQSNGHTLAVLESPHRDGSQETEGWDGKTQGNFENI